MTAVALEEVALGPQPGFQERFLGSQADITIGGGAAGCGKTYAEILAGGRHFEVPGFRAVFFRRTTKQVRNPGGLWDEAWKVYPYLGATPNSTDLEWSWPSGAKVKMAHLEHDNNVRDWQGAQVPLFIFDELTHFTADMFWYMLSRNRSTSGVRPYILASCNPDADSWVADLIAWWIDQDENSENYGYPIPERAGKLRYFTRQGDVMVWGDTPAEVTAQAPDVPAELVKSLTFIPGKLEENQILEKADPGYRANLMAMSRVERARLLEGNWKVRASAGSFFKRHEARLIDVLPADIEAVVRSWDLAATEPSETNPQPDWTCGVKIGKRKGGRFVIMHAEFARKRSEDVRKLILGTAEHDGKAVKIRLPQDPAQAGVDQKESYAKLLAGYTFTFERESGSKETRADPFAAQWQAGNVEILRGPWNIEYLSQMEGFPSKRVKDDAVDGTTGGFKQLSAGRPSWADVL
jgi:predicted phage terminase large subunit-like protein